MGKLIGLIALVVIVVVVWGNMPEGDKTGKPPTPPPANTQVKQPAPRPTPAVTPDPTVAVTPDPDPQPEPEPLPNLGKLLTAAEDELSNAERRLTMVEDSVVQRAKESDGYAKALSEIDGLKKQVKEFKDSPNALAEFSRQLMVAQDQPHQIVAGAVATDPEIIKIQNEVARLNAKAGSLRTQIAYREQNREAEAIALAEAEANDNAKGAFFAGQAFAERLVPMHLKNPKVAKFDHESNVIATVKENAWKVSGVVRSTNSFGATVPERWDVLVMRSGEDYFPMAIQLGDKVVWKLMK